MILFKTKYILNWWGYYWIAHSVDKEFQRLLLALARSLERHICASLYLYIITSGFNILTLAILLTLKRWARRLSLVLRLYKFKYFHEVLKSISTNYQYSHLLYITLYNTNKLVSSQYLNITHIVIYMLFVICMFGLFSIQYIFLLGRGNWSPFYYFVNIKNRRIVCHHSHNLKTRYDS